MTVLCKIKSKLPRNGLFLRCVFLKEVPLNSHGKKDRRKLQRVVEDTPPDISFNEFVNFEDFLLNLFEGTIHWQSSNFNAYNRKKTFIENGGDSFSAIFLETRIYEYFRFLSNDDDAKLTLLYDRIVSNTFEELIEYLSGELVKRREQVGHYRKSDHQEVTGRLNGDLRRLKAQGDPPFRLERQDMLSYHGKSGCETVLKKVRTNERCTCSNKECLQLDDSENLSRNDWSFAQKRKRKHDLHEQKGVDAQQNFVESSPSFTNHKPSLCQRNLHSKFCSDRVWSCNGAEANQKPPLESNEAIVKGDLISITLETNIRSSCNTPQNNYSPVSTLEHKDDLILSSNINTIDCYCSVSRGSKFSVCDYCISRGLKSTCTSILTRLTVKSLTLMKKNWFFDTSKCVDASPLIVCSGNHLSCIAYIGSHSHYFYAINTDDGSVAWKTKLGGRVESSAAVSKDGKTIIVGCYDHYIYVISRQEGIILWQLKTGESIKCSPVVSKVNGFVFIGSHDHHMYAIDTQKQSQIWRAYCGGGSIFGSPAFSRDCKLLFVGTLGGNLIAVDSDTGVIKWKLTVNRPVFTSPLRIDDDICFCCVDGNVHVVSNSGTLRWTLKIPGPIFSSPSVAPSCDINRFVLGSHDMAVYCISNDGEIIWRTQLESPIFAIPTVIPCKGSHCDGFCKENDTPAEYLIFVCSKDGKLYVLNLADGNIVKTYVFPNEVFSSPVVFGSSMVVGCRDNSVFSLSL